MNENDNMEMDLPSPRLMAAVTVKMPNYKVGGSWRSGRVIKAGQEIPTEGVHESHIKIWLESKVAYFEGQIPLLREVAPLRREKDLNVSSIKKGDREDNPLDDGIDLVPGEGDPELQNKIALLAQTQKERAEAEGEELLDDPEPEERHVEVNAETGEVIEHGGEDFMDDETEADSQVS